MYLDGIRLDGPEVAKVDGFRSVVVLVYSNGYVVVLFFFRVN
jgi:hypothetical protein